MPVDPSIAPAAASAPAALALRAARALAGTDDAVLVAALLDQPVHAVRAALAALALHEAPAVPGSAPAGPGGVGGPGEEAIADDALAPVAAWWAAAPEAAAATVARAITLHLQQGRVERAAPVALGYGSAAQRLGLLQRAGFALMWRPQRALLGRLLDSLATEPAAESAPVLALRLAWWVEVERVPHVADRRLQQGTPLAAPEEALFRARIAQVFDDARGALGFAREAVAGWATDLQPLALLAQYALGFALLDAGQPAEALVPLAAVVRGATRDGLPLLLLEALAVQARAHDELADAAGLRATLQAARQLIEGLASADPVLRQLPALQALQRLQRSQGLRQVFDSGRAPPPALAERAPATAYEAFPDRVIDAQAALQAGDLAAAGAALDELQRRLAEAFHCAKWRNGERHARLWWLARRADSAALQALLVPPAAGGAGEAATLVELHQAVLQAAAAALAARPWPLDTLEALATLLQARGLRALQRRLLLIRALGPPPRPEALLDWLGQVLEAGDPGAATELPACNAPLQDALWLAPKLAAALEGLLASVGIVHHPAERALAQRLFQHLQAPPPARPQRPGPAAEAPPPADLTLREWQILQLIGQHFTNEQIAARLHVSVATVKTHINRVYGKLQITSRAEAVQRANHLAQLQA
jgi:ATP/maltotriose-dependent transcriptional regulator MalT